MIIKNVGIVSGKRTPFGSYLGAFRQIPSPLLLSSLIPPTLSNFPENFLTTAVFGCCLPSNLGILPIKQALSLSGLNTQATLINSGHSGGLRALIEACKSLLMTEKAALCGGFDSVSTCPHIIKGRTGWKSEIKDLLLEVYQDELGRHFGLALEETVVKLDIRRDIQDDYFSHARLRRKIAKRLKHFEKEVVKLDLLSEDEHPDYPENKVLGPLFYSAGTVTAFTTAQPADGAVALLLARTEVIQQFDLSCLALVSAVWVGRNENFWTAVKEGVYKVLNTHGLGVSNIDLWEINDFFAVIPEAICKILNIDRGKVNITGGNLGIGDTLAASSARCVLTASLVLDQRDLRNSIVISVNCSEEVCIVLLKSIHK